MKRQEIDWNVLLSTIEKDKEKKKIAVAQSSPLGIKFINKCKNTVLQLYLANSNKVNFDIVKQLIEDGVELMHRNRKFETALMIAA